MRVTYLKGHLKSAENLYRQRQVFQAQDLLPAATLAKLEARLCLHLNVLARAGHRIEEPAKPAQAFIAVALMLLRQESEVITRACELADAEAGNTAAIFEALALLPPADLPPSLPALYEAWPALRPTLLELAGRTQADVPAGLLSQAELQSDDAALQAAALRYVAERAESGLERFRAYYASQDPMLQRLALWGGLLRQDAQAVAALRSALEHAQQDTRAPLLRLMALSGEPDSAPILRQAAASDPVNLYLLGLYGRKDIVADLLSALESPASAVPAARAWSWLFGLELPLKSRLSVVGEAGEEPVAEGGEMPDVQAARTHWREQEETWSDDSRRLQGSPLELALNTAAGELAGTAGRDVIDLLALHSLGRTCLDPQGWIALRRQQLAPAPSAPAQERKRA